MTAYWFRPKRYGYGATPTTWQGWAVTGVVLCACVAAGVTMATRGAMSLWFWAAIAIEIAALFALVIVSRNKTDGEWRWRWGGPE